MCVYLHSFTFTRRNLTPFSLILLCLCGHFILAHVGFKQNLSTVRFNYKGFMMASVKKGTNDPALVSE